MNAVVDRGPRQRSIPLPARGGEMAFLELGPQDRPVDLIFSHANGFNGRTYRSILEPLAGEFRILALDLRGHGASTLPADGEGWPGWHGFRDDLLAFLAAEIEGPVVLAGHSMGGTTSLLAAAAEPARVRSLALFDPVLFDGGAERPASESPLVAGALRRRADFPSREAVLEAYAGRGAFRTWSAEQLADYVAGGFRDTADGVTLACTPAWEALSFRLHNYDPFEAFRESRCPIRILKAEEASTARFEGREAEIETNPRISVTVVPGTTQFLPMERPDLVRETLRAALA
jgi:pimeloyl-ACP methyl ester carboxylesterase